MKKIKIFISAIILGISPLLAQNNAEDKGFEISKNLEIFSSVYKNIHLNYVDDIEPGKLMTTAINAMLSSLDPYTNYIPESNIEDVKLQLMGQYGGIGSLIHQKGNFVYIAEPYEGLPADKVGLKPGDKILEIDGEDAEGRTTPEVSDRLRGQAGSKVKIKVERNGKVLEKTIVREEIKLKPVPYYGFVGNTDYGYIKLTEFTQNAAKEVGTALNKLKSQNSNIKGVILDLRGNGGGLLNEAVDIVNLFVPKSELVVQTKGKVVAKNTKHYTRNNPMDTEIPVVVLIDGYSASASEIVSGSLQDLDRAVIIGSRSFGKGLVQNILPLTYNSQMKVTVSKYYIPSGRCIQALDYSHKDENGKATKVPDSLKTAFKTRNGRTVYDGFGIEPDVEIQDSLVADITIALMRNFLVFDYATEFVNKHESILPAGEFEITDEIYNDFKEFLKDKKYEYFTSTERALKLLREAAKEDKYIAAISDNIDELEKKIHSDKSIDLEKNKKEISELLKAEILSRYYYEKGRIEGTLKTDPEIIEAISILSDSARYNKILNKGKK